MQTGWRSTLIVGLASVGVASSVLAQAPKPKASTTYTKPGAGTQWVIDREHSEVSFRIRHMMGRVRGHFTDWDGMIVTRDKDWTHGTVNVNVRTKSVDTRNTVRDADLRSERFFDVARFPALTFESTGIVAEGDSVEIGGLLTIKGRTKRVVLKGQFLGIARDRNNQERIAFDGTTAINRKEFGLTWNQVLEGGAMIGDDVEIELAIEAVRK